MASDLIVDGEDEAYRYMVDVVKLSDAEVEYFGLDMEKYRNATEAIEIIEEENSIFGEDGTK